MNISANDVKTLREKTGAGMMDCKKALNESDGNFEKAIDYLRKKGIASAGKRAGKTTKEGAIHSYIHAGAKVGVLVEINCETDFVARTDQFQQLTKDICMHIAASSPQWVQSSEVPEDVIKKEKEIAVEQMRTQGKPEAVLEKIADENPTPFYALDDSSAVKVDGDTISVVSEGQWKKFN